MTKIKTYCDANVLITASKYQYNKYLKILDDPNREFVSSIFVKLETLPKAHFHGYNKQVDFLETFFEYVTIWPKAQDLELISNNALELAKEYDLNAIDALHLACAIHLNCNEIFSQEKLTKPMYSVPGIKIIHINH